MSWSCMPCGSGSTAYLNSRLLAKGIEDAVKGRAKERANRLQYEADEEDKKNVSNVFNTVIAANNGDWSVAEIAKVICAWIFALPTLGLSVIAYEVSQSAKVDELEADLAELLEAVISKEIHLAEEPVESRHGNFKIRHYHDSVNGVPTPKIVFYVKNDDNKFEAFLEVLGEIDQLKKTFKDDFVWVTQIANSRAVPESVRDAYARLPKPDINAEPPEQQILDIEGQIQQPPLLPRPPIQRQEEEWQQEDVTATSVVESQIVQNPINATSSNALSTQKVIDGQDLPPTLPNVEAHNQGEIQHAQPDENSPEGDVSQGDELVTPQLEMTIFEDVEEVRFTSFTNASVSPTTTPTKPLSAEFTAIAQTQKQEKSPVVKNVDTEGEGNVEEVHKFDSDEVWQKTLRRMKESEEKAQNSDRVSRRNSDPRSLSHANVEPKNTQPFGQFGRYRESPDIQRTRQIFHKDTGRLISSEEDARLKKDILPSEQKQNILTTNGADNNKGKDIKANEKKTQDDSETEYSSSDEEKLSEPEQLFKAQLKSPFTSPSQHFGQQDQIDDRTEKSSATKRLETSEKSEQLPRRNSVGFSPTKQQISEARQRVQTNNVNVTRNNRTEGNVPQFNPFSIDSLLSQSNTNFLVDRIKLAGVRGSTETPEKKPRLRSSSDGSPLSKQSPVAFGLSNKPEAKSRIEAEPERGPLPSDQRTDNVDEDDSRRNIEKFDDPFSNPY